MRKYFILVISIFLFIQGCTLETVPTPSASPSKDTLVILSSSENQILSPILNEFSATHDFNVVLKTKGSIDGMFELQQTPEKYDAVWLSQSQWITMGDKQNKVKNIKSIMTSPVVWGIKKSIAEKLDFVGKDVSVSQLIDAVKQNKLTFSMTSASQSNSGSSAYMGFIYSILGKSNNMTIEDIHNPKVKNGLQTLFSGINRSSGSSSFLKDMFLAGDYPAMINYESIIIQTNQKLIAQGKEPLYAVYPYDGLSLSDYMLGYIDNGNKIKETQFQQLQQFLLSTDVQKQILTYGFRTGYGGIVENPDLTIFNPNWGINVSKVLSPIKFPDPLVTWEALNFYQSELRKPSYTIFCLDFSGSMHDNGGETQMKLALKTLLLQEEASKYLLQGSDNDIIVLVPFSSNIIGTYRAEGKDNFAKLYDKISPLVAKGGTDIYSPSIKALQELSKVDTEKYVTSVVLMTDGESNVGATFKDFSNTFKSLNKDIPVFSISFGDAELNPAQLDQIASLSNAKRIDSKEGLISAFKKVRGFN